MLEAYWRRYKDRVLFLGINFQDTEDAILAVFPGWPTPGAGWGLTTGSAGFPSPFS